ncbi:MAG: ribosome maturation factor RimM [Armatimonadetes bacterium]|nr:ribosome maturation factor RimM [Armatimonadota bacterium]MDW8027607.1 ribosome maturation factor RimM [Armatimonadota bacterium]
MSVKKKVTIVFDELRDWTQTIAVIVSTKGLKGEVKVKPVHGAADQIFVAGNELCLLLPSGRRQKLTIQNCYPKSGVWIVKFKGFEAINDAEKLVGLKLAVHKDWRPKLEKGEFLLSELLGMKIVTETGELVGEVSEILESQAYDLVITERGIIPMSREFIKKVDRKGRKIVVKLPKGLLSEEVSENSRPKWQK